MTPPAKPLTADEIATKRRQIECDVCETRLGLYRLTDTQRRTIEQQSEQIEKLREAAGKLTLRLREIEINDSFKGIWSYLQVHDYRYTGPNWELPLKELEDAICQPSEALAATEPVNDKR